MSLSRANSSTANGVGRPDRLYPSPFFDIAQSFMPRSIKETFAWCENYQLTHPLINAVTQKLSTYPITDLIYDEGDEDLIKEYRDIMEDDLLIRTFLVEQNLDRVTYGNSFASVAFPFKKMLKCKACGKKTTAESAAYKFRSYRFFISCSCGHDGPAEASDMSETNRKRIRLIRWNPASITIQYNEITGIKRYYYAIPTKLKNQLALGTPDVVENTPQAFIDALRNKKTIMLTADKLFHSKRPTISRSGPDSGWGAPLILPVLKHLFLLQILMKAQEAISLEHIVPLRVMFPQAAADGGNPYANVNLKDWQKEVRTQVDRWKNDHNYIPVMPFPVGHQVIGGQGKAYMLHQELRGYYELILGGMGVPTGFYYGELHYSGGSVNLRALENEFLGNRQDMRRLVQFIGKQVSTFLNMKHVRMRFKPFKMADDIQRANLDMQLNGQNKISTNTLLQSRDYDYEKELKQIKRESKDLDIMQREQALAGAATGGEQLLVQTRYQVQAQKMQNESLPQDPAAAGAPQEGGAQLAGGQPQEGQPQEGQPQEGQPQEGQQPAGQPGGDQGPDQTVAYDQSRTQQMPADDSQPTAYVDMFAQAGQWVAQLKQLTDVERYQQLAQLRSSNPSLYRLVNTRLHEDGMKAPAAATNVLPSRAAPDRAQI